MDPQQQTQTSTTSNQGSLDPQVVNLAKAIRQTESGGDFAAQGKSGEYGAYQFTDSTWNNLAKKYGINSSLQESTPDQQNEVAYKQIDQWKQQGYNVGQIASMWNAGAGEPNAYQGNFSDGTPATGKNSYGVQYDVPQYAKSVAQAYQTLKSGGQVSADPNNPSSVGSTQNTNAQSQSSSLGGDVLGGLKWLGNTLFPIAGDLYHDVTGTNTGANQKSVISQIADAGLSALPFIPGLDVLAPEADVVAEGAEAGGGLISKLTGSPITKMAGIGAGAGALGAIGQGGGVKQAIGGATLGGITGGALGLGGSLVSSALDNIPTRLTQGVFKGITPETANYALENKSVGSVENMLADSQKATETLGGNINDILSGEKYGASLGLGDKALQDTLSNFPNAGFKSTNDIAEALKNVVPLQQDLVDKVVSGDATLAEKNTLRQAIDQNVYNKSADLPKLSADKKVANVFSNYLRKEVQTQAPETADLFSDLSNEIKLKRSLIKLNNKGTSAVSFRSLMGTLAGLGVSGGNPVGGLLGYGTEKLTETPEGNFLLAKTLNKAGNVLNSRVAQGAGLVGTGLISKFAGQWSGK